MSKTAALQAVDGVFAEIGEALAGGNEVRILGFGSFVTRNRPARTARNPGTGETIEIRARLQARQTAQGRGERQECILNDCPCRNACRTTTDGDRPLNPRDCDTMTAAFGSQVGQGRKTRYIDALGLPAPQDRHVTAQSAAT